MVRGLACAHADGYEVLIIALRPRRHVLSAVALLLVAVSLAGCRLDLVADVVISDDGGGSVALSFGLDAAMLEELDALDLDPTAELASAVAIDEEWSLDRTTRPDGGVTVTVARPVSDARGIGPVLGELAAGLEPHDPALLLDLDIATTDDDGIRVQGSGGVRPPAVPAATRDGRPVGADAAQLAATAARSVSPSLRITVPGTVLAHDGDELDGRTVTWELPVGGQRSLSATAAPAPWWRELPVGVPVTGGVVLVAALGGWSLRARSRSRVSSPEG